MTDFEIGKFLSYILRHSPQSINITLDENGWADVEELIISVNRLKGDILTVDRLEYIVETNYKKRYSFNEDKTLIRANQGHSINIDLGLTSQIPPDTLFHGSATKFKESIQKLGLIPKNRQYVHLSSAFTTAVNVGQRHGTPIVYKIDCKQMVVDGYEFFLADNNVWLTKSVPYKYLNL
ncbi:RNA 2'-phosphotransferase [Candidatus Epulonipiscium fishelsonii]|uniref:RNA 2'-phosphotransferase n=1 Tax=Candidatus Epulonipiscium fishelsonii TaxID=77094 RepID=A0ACC8XC50_9FIRM|nr:RNA 2'-phosphotransferase [Epulopiscium sp. SCG-B11WGA-EpuloA1]ONI42735.1 RNA 2'-phosphotransferase [Epulopiscium sp. SCG-B05WGA-EpuloA1]